MPVCMHDPWENTCKCTVIAYSYSLISNKFLDINCKCLRKPDRWHTWPVGHRLRLAVGIVNGWLGLEIGVHDFLCMSKYGPILSGFLRHLKLIIQECISVHRLAPGIITCLVFNGGSLGGTLFIQLTPKFARHTFKSYK